MSELQKQNETREAIEVLSGNRPNWSPMLTVYLARRMFEYHELDIAKSLLRSLLDDPFGSFPDRCEFVSTLHLCELYPEIVSYYSKASLDLFSKKYDYDEARTIAVIVRNASKHLSIELPTKSKVELEFVLEDARTTESITNDLCHRSSPATGAED